MRILRAGVFSLMRFSDFLLQCIFICIVNSHILMERYLYSNRELLLKT